MEVFASATEFLRQHQPERPVFGLRPQAAERAATWFLATFPGSVVYATKANDAPAILDALVRAGIRKFDVASMAEIERMAAVPGSELFFMNPVKSRASIAAAYFDHGVRSFALDSEEELDKILAVTGNPRDLTLYVRLACPNAHSLIPLEGKFGVEVDEAPALMLAARQKAARLGVTFHVGSQAVIPASFADALELVGGIIRSSGVFVEAIDVGGGFPSRYPHSDPPPLADYVAEIARAFDRLSVSDTTELLCEPGRALVAEGESLILRVDARRGDALYVNDGAYGALYDATHCDFVYPARLIPAGGRRVEAMAPFSLYGPSCDSTDHMPGPFMLPACAREGDRIEIGQIGAYGRVLASRFNGFGTYDEVLLEDAPMMSMFEETEHPAIAPQRAGRAG